MANFFTAQFHENIHCKSNYESRALQYPLLGSGWRIEEKKQTE